MQIGVLGDIHGAFDTVDEIMKRHFKGHDDALVLVVRFVGRRDE